MLLQEGVTMKARASAATRCSVVTVITFSVLLSLASATVNDTRLYQTKCAQCHGKNGEGKRSIKAPSLVSGEAKEMSDERIRDFITARANGEMARNPSHTSLKKRLTDEQINRIIVDIRKMQENHQ
jgi:cytochrome c553